MWNLEKFDHRHRICMRLERRKVFREGNAVLLCQFAERFSLRVGAVQNSFSTKKRILKQWHKIRRWIIGSRVKSEYFTLLRISICSVCNFPPFYPFQSSSILALDFPEFFVFLPKNPRICLSRKKTIQRERNLFSQFFLPLLGGRSFGGKKELRFAAEVGIETGYISQAVRIRIGVAAGAVLSFHFLCWSTHRSPSISRTGRNPPKFAVKWNGEVHASREKKRILVHIRIRYRIWVFGPWEQKEL